MNTSTASLSETFNSSIAVLTRPSVQTFEQYERRGNLQTALVYVGITAVIAGLFGMLTGSFTDQGVVRGALAGLISTFVNFLLFTGTTFYVGRSQGGTGTFDEVAYTFSLFWVPLNLLVQLVTLVLAITIIGLCLVPFVALAGLIASVYFAYLAVQSSMNLRDSSKAIITLVAAGLVTLVGGFIIGLIL